ncbi:MAG: endonuclease III [Deltaproteobacteria bacterium]|nr:endonuclease III [Deltaproteobacteria bacterium]
MKKRAQKDVSEQEVHAVFAALLKLYPDPKTELNYESPFQLLIAVILSAQCTDVRVNKTTPELFKRYPTADALAAAPASTVEKIIQSCGFFRAKARAITQCAKGLVNSFGGSVPKTLEELTTLPGVGRKTASVVLNQAFNIPAIAVDTHVKRVSQRLGWAHHPEPDKIEMELREVIPQSLWSIVNSLLILHGRRTCMARKPACERCTVTTYCQYFRDVVGKPIKPKSRDAT